MNQAEALRAAVFWQICKDAGKTLAEFKMLAREAHMEYDHYQEQQRMSEEVMPDEPPTTPYKEMTTDQLFELRDSLPEGDELDKVKQALSERGFKV
jgi:hypothetical protein